MEQDALPPVLTECAQALYAALLDTGPTTLAELASFTGHNAQESEAGLACLRSLGLVRKSVGGAELQAISPESALGTTLGPLRRDQNRLQRVIERVQSDLDSLGELYSTRQRQAGETAWAEEMTELGDVRRHITELAHGAQHEILTSQPGGPRDSEVLQEAMDRTETTLRRGVSMRTIYQHTAQFSPVTVEYVRQVTELGAQVRTVAEGFPQALVFDRSIAVIALPGSSLGAVLVRHPALVTFIAEAFERSWSDATPFPVTYERKRVSATANEVRQSIIRLLLQGMTDKQIADRVGLSPRACQRHIATWMQEIGARSRIQAGFLAAQTWSTGGEDGPVPDPT